MRRLMLLTLLAPSIALHSGDALPQGAQHAQLVTAQNPDINYRKCAAVILIDQIRQLGHRDRLTVYVTVMGQDADQATLDALRPLVPSVRPASEMPNASPPVLHSEQWHYSVGWIHSGPADGYTAMVSFYCGALCGASIEYRLKKHGDSCAVIDHKILVEQ